MILLVRDKRWHPLTGYVYSCAGRSWLREGWAKRSSIATTSFVILDSTCPSLIISKLKILRKKHTNPFYQWGDLKNDEHQNPHRTPSTLGDTKGLKKEANLHVRSLSGSGTNGSIFYHHATHGGNAQLLGGEIVDGLGCGNVTSSFTNSQQPESTPRAAWV